MPARGYRSGEDRTCEECERTFYCYPSDLRRGRGRFCSNSCATASYAGAGNPKWRGGRTVAASGYVYAYAPDHPHATHHGYVMEHRLVVEAAIGRHLDPAEQVHHINHVRDDNRLENLQLTSDVSEHRILHAYYQDHPCGSCGALVRRSIAHRRRWSQAFCSRRCAALSASLAASAKAAEARL